MTAQDPDPSAAARTPSPPATEHDAALPARVAAGRVPEDWIGAVSMAVLASITFANVVARYFTNESFAWTEELSVSLMVVLTMIAASAAVTRDRHIRIEAFFSAGSPRRQRRLAIVSALATALAFVIVFGLGLRLFWDDYRYEVTSPGIGVPQWWYTIWLPLLALLIAARSVQQLVRHLGAR
ncbi:MAG TPA: TRAP transporter small permease [Burkholderiaceae bacterium]|nr:TRAP transporter small permease [Burkholderiaceae bacterium]